MEVHTIIFDIKACFQPDLWIVDTLMRLTTTFGWSMHAWTKEGTGLSRRKNVTSIKITLSGIELGTVTSFIEIIQSLIS